MPIVFTVILSTASVALVSMLVATLLAKVKPSRKSTL